MMARGEDQKLLSIVEELAKRANGWLTSYIAIHNEVFEFRLRKILPFPFLFQAINYQEHSSTLTGIRAGFERCEQDASALQNERALPNNGKVFLSCLLEYLNALHETIDTLVSITAQLHRKSQGEHYYWKDYKYDCARYKEQRRRYAAIGEDLNSHYHRLWKNIHN